MDTPKGYPFAIGVPLPPEGQKPSGACCATCIYVRGERMKATCSNPTYHRIEKTFALGCPDSAGWCCSAWSETIVEKPEMAERILRIDSQGIALLDLGQDDVHIPSTPKRSDMAKVYTYEFGGKSYECDDSEDTTDMISSEERKSLPGEKFALPEDRKYPIDTPARIRNAAARLEQQKGSMSPEKYSKAKAAIGRAAKSHGIDSEYNKKEMADHPEPDGDELGGKGDGDEDDKKEMTGGRLCRADGVELSSKNAEDQEVWIQIAKQGKFAGHASGPFEMNSKTWAEILHNFSSQKNRFIPVDFEHASEQPPTSGNIPMYGAPAQGWITKLEVRPDGNLWGLVRWGELAKKYIRAGQYRYLSPAIVFDSKDRVTGKSVGARLSSAALTNSPFLDGLAPLAAKRVEGNGNPDLVKTICQALKLPDYMDASGACMSMRLLASTPAAAAQAKSLRDALRLPLTMSDAEVFTHARIACGEISPPSSAAVRHEETQPMNNAAKEKVIMADDQNKDAKISELTLTLTAAQTEVKTMKAEHETKVSALQAENTALKARIAEFETAELEGRVDMAIRVWGEKKGLSQEMRPHLLTFAKTSPDAFNAMYPQPAPGQQLPNFGGKVSAGGRDSLPQIGTGGVAPEQRRGNVVPMNRQGTGMTIEQAIVHVQKNAKEQGVTLTREEAYENAHILLTNLAADKFAGNGG